MGTSSPHGPLKASKLPPTQGTAPKGPNPALLGPPTAENLLKDPPHPKPSWSCRIPLPPPCKSRGGFYVAPESCFTSTLPSPPCPARAASTGLPGLELSPTDTQDRVSGSLLLPPWAGMRHPPSLMNYPRAVSTQPRELPAAAPGGFASHQNTHGWLWG